MGRERRIQFGGAWYHVMNRGARHGAIYEDDVDRRSFLSLMADAHDRWDAETHAYALMGNHYHLLVRTPRGNIAEVMHHLDGVHARRFNVRHGHDGPLFRGRYRSIVIESDTYLSAVARYIHRNPVEAGLAHSAVDYRWSSFRAYVGVEKSPPWLRLDSILTTFGSGGRRAHAAFVEGEQMGDALPDSYPNWSEQSTVLGPDGYARAADPPSQVSDDEVALLGFVETAVIDAFRVDQASLFVSTPGRRRLPRMVAALVAARAGGLDRRTVAEHFGFTPTGLSSSMLRLECPERQDPLVAARVAAVAAVVQSFNRAA